MARNQDDSYAWVGELIAAVAAAGLTFCLWLMTGCTQVVVRSYTRWGEKRLLRVNGLLFGAAMLTTVLAFLLGANVLAAYLGIAAGLAFVGTAWLLDAIYTEQARQGGDGESTGLTAVLGEGWWLDQDQES